MATLQNIDFKTSVFTGTSKQVGVGETLAKVVSNTMSATSNYIDYREREKRLEEAEAEKQKRAKAEESAMSAATMANGYYKKFAEGRYQEKSEEEQRKFTEQYIAGLNFGDIEDEDVRMNIENTFNRLIISEQGQAKAEKISIQKENSNIALIDSQIQLKDNISKLYAEGKTYKEIKALINKEYFSDDFEYNGILTNIDKIRFDKILSGTMRTIETNIIKENKIEAEAALNEALPEYTSVMDKEGFDSLFSKIKRMDKFYKKDDFVKKFTSYGKALMQQKYENGDFQGKTADEAQAEVFGSWIGNIKNKKHTKGIAKFKTKIDEDYKKLTVLTDFVKNATPSTDIDDATYKNDKGIEVYMPKAYKEEAANNILRGILSSQTTPEQKGIEIGTFYSKNKQYAKEYLDSVANRINSKYYETTAGDLLMMDSARKNGYVGSGSFNNTLDSLLGIAKRHHINVRTKDGLEQVKGIYQASKETAATMKEDGVKPTDVKKVIKEKVEDALSTSSFGFSAAGTLTGRAANLIGNMFTDTNESVNSDVINKLTYKYMLELGGADYIDEAIGLAVAESNKVYAGSSIPVGLILEGDTESQIAKNNNLESGDVEEVIKEEITRKYLEKTEGDFDADIQIVPVDASSPYNTDYRIFVNNPDGSLAQHAVYDLNGLKNMFKLGSLERERQGIEDDKNTQEIIDIFFKKPSDKEKASLSKSIGNRYEDDGGFGLIGDIYRWSKAKTDKANKKYFDEMYKPEEDTTNASLEEEGLGNELLGFLPVSGATKEIGKAIIPKVIKAKDTMQILSIIKRSNKADELIKYHKKLQKAASSQESTAMVKAYNNKLQTIIKAARTNAVSKIMRNKNFHFAKPEDTKYVTEAISDLTRIKEVARIGDILSKYINRIGISKEARNGLTSKDFGVVRINGLNGGKAMKWEEVQGLIEKTSKELGEYAKKYSIKKPLDSNSIDDALQSLRDIQVTKGL